MKSSVILASVLAFAVSSIAGQAQVKMGKDSLYNTNLVGIDSLKFEKDRRGADSTFKDSLFMNGFGSKIIRKIPLNLFNSISFQTNYHDDEMMIVNVGSGPFAGTHLFPLRDIKYVETVSMDNTIDSDGDGLYDYDELFKWGTNPNDKDTDGDGFNDREELNEFNPDNPTRWNPNIADVPQLNVTMLSTPTITLLMTTSESESKTQTISEGKSTSNQTGISMSEQESASLMNGWSVSGETGTKDGGYAQFTLGYNGSYTETTGHTWTSNEQKNITETYSDIKADASTKGTSITGAKICMQAAIENTANVAYTINSMKLSASAYSRNGNVKVISELDAENGWGETTLPVGKSVKMRFCNDKLTLAEVEGLIYNPAAIFLEASSYKITANFKDQAQPRDFTQIYTDVGAKTAVVNIDYGPYHNVNKKQVESFRVATNYLFNKNALDRDDYYDRITLSDILNILGYTYEESSTEMTDGKSHFGLTKLNNVGYSTSDQDTASWFVAITRAAFPNQTKLYSVVKEDFRLDTIMIGSGDRVQFIYNEDRDHDGVPASVEKMYGISDDNKDSDGDGISDFDEINGWMQDISGYGIDTTYSIKGSWGIHNLSNYPTEQIEKCENSYGKFTLQCSALELSNKSFYPKKLPKRISCDLVSVNKEKIGVARYNNCPQGARCMVEFSGSCNIDATLKYYDPKKTKGLSVTMKVTDAVAKRDSVPRGPFFTNPAMDNTDGDEYLDKEDPNPSAPEANTDDRIDYILVTDKGNGKTVDVKKECVYDISGNVCTDSIFIADTVYNSSAEVLVQTKKPVMADTGVQVFLKGEKQNVTKETDMRYKFTVKGISIARKDTFDIKVTAENGDSITYKFLIRSILAVPQNMELASGADHSTLFVNYEADTTDSRLQGYVILRAEAKGKNQHNEYLSRFEYKPTTSKPSTGMSLGNGISIVNVNNNRTFSFEDKVGGGSPYYTYRVYSFAKEGSMYYFSEGSNVATKSVGRIKFEIQYVNSGTEYLWDYKHASRKSFTLDAIFYEGTNPSTTPIHHYTYHYHKGGSSNHGNTIIYTAEADRDIDHNTNSVKPDKTVYSAEIGKRGIMMNLNVIAKNYGTSGHHNVVWPYNKLAQVLNMTASFVPDSKDGSAPPNNWKEQKFNYGEKGIEYNPNNDGCDNNCGHEPHAGFIFKFNYSWVD